MLKIQDYFGSDSCYFGDNSQWLVVYTIRRDSDLLEESNFFCLEDIVKNGSFQLPDYATIERASCSLCGWIDYLIINPDMIPKELLNKIESTLEDLEDYPVVNEEDYSMRQYDQFLDSFDEAIKDASNELEIEFTEQQIIDLQAQLTSQELPEYVDKRDIIELYMELVV